MIVDKVETVVTKRIGDQMFSLEKNVNSIQPQQDIQQTVERVVQDKGVLNNEILANKIKEVVQIKLKEVK